MMLVRLFILCRQGFSLLCTPVPRPLSDVQAQGEEEIGRGVRHCVGWRKEQ